MVGSKLPTLQEIDPHMAKTISKKAAVEACDRKRRMKWWHDARFGMFIHYGLYSIRGHHEWAMDMDQTPIKEYEKLVEQFNPVPNAPRLWAKLARKAGMKYMVLTTKHHEGFCLWDSDVTDYCVGKRGPKRDLVAEYVKACRAEGLKVGFYYSLMDWHHSDGYKCATSEPARRRFCDYTYALVEELMTRYGKIDILWYDIPHPLENAKRWESDKLNAMARKHQPHILINDRSMLDEDFGTPEGEIHAAPEGRAWEACMTFNGAWGYMNNPPEDWESARDVVMMLHQCTCHGGNLLLNVGPHADGTVPEIATERLTKVGKWLKAYGDRVVYGDRPRTKNLVSTLNMVNWTAIGNTAYAWLRMWPGESFDLGRWKGKVKSIKLLTPTGETKVKFKQEPNRLRIFGLPAKCPEKHVSIAILAIVCASKPSRGMATHYEAKPHWEAKG
jgi:alpha-L-fucosidase